MCNDYKHMHSEALPVFEEHVVVEPAVGRWPAAQEAPVVELQGFPEDVGTGVPVHLQAGQRPRPRPRVTGSQQADKRTSEHVDTV